MHGASDNSSDSQWAAADDGIMLAGGLACAVVAASPWAIVLLDASGIIRFVNEAGLALFQAARAEDAVGQAFATLWPAEERAQVERAVSDGALGRQSQLTAYCPTLKGTPRWLEVAMTPIQHADTANAPCVMCNVRDITQTMAIQESLKNSQQRFRALADHMAQLAWMADETGHLFWYNKRWMDYTGTTLADMEGWGWAKVHHPDHLDRVVQKWSAHLRSGDVWEDVFPLRGSDGAYRWFLSRAMPFRDANGRITLWCGTNTDITEQRNATQRLRQKARLIELSHEAIFSWDIDGAILTWNRGCEELYGYKQSEAIGRICHDLLRSQHAVSTDELHTILVADGAWSGEVLHYAKDGTKVWVDSRHELLRVGGKSVVLETNRDVTDRRKADEIRNMLVAELNHRVKNTLAIVQSIASQTARSSTNMRDYAESFRGRLQSLATAHNVLTDAHWYGADLNKLVMSEIDVTFGQSANVRVSGDPIFLSPQTALHFTLILHELATNAVKHGALSCPSGSVEVSWTRSGTDNAKLELLWRERGGPSVFEPRHKGFGTSLIGRSGRLPNIKTDLRFERDGVECMIIADLKEEQEAAVLFNPVRSEMPLVMAPRIPRPVRNLSSHKVLVIEPEPLLALELQETLAEAGFVPIGPATTAQSAVEAIARGGAHAVIVDTGSILGRQLEMILEKLKAANLPYVLVGDTAPAACDGVPVLQKPVRPGALLEALTLVAPPPAAGSDEQS